MTNEKSTQSNKTSESKVVYRDFCDDDIRDVSLLLASIWNSRESGECALFSGMTDLAHFAGRTTYMRVALLDGQVVGLAGVRVGSASEKHVAKWNKVLEDAFLSLQEIDPAKAQELRDYYDFENRTLPQMISDGKVDANYELTIFVVSEKTRGHGVGSKLLAQVTDNLKSAGATSFYLYTDTNCTWQYYENRGMRRASSYKTSAEERQKFEVDELYIYSSKIF